MLDALLNWAEAHEAILWWIGAASVAALVLTLATVVVIVVRMPADFFVDRAHHHLAWLRDRPALRLALAVLRNFLGWVFLLAGAAMLVLPGQGLLTIFIGVLLMDFPGKLRLEARLVRTRAVHRPMNWIRRKAGREPLSL